MGYLLRAECSCGYQHENIYMGGGIKNHEFSCEAPFYCEHCSKIKLRNLIKKRPKCQKCKEQGTQIHHLTYERVGNEKLTDLVLLCDKCHMDVHTILYDGSFNNIHTTYEDMVSEEIERLMENDKI